jgi:hypothetical protein
VLGSGAMAAADMRRRCSCKLRGRGSVAWRHGAGTGEEGAARLQGVGARARRGAVAREDGGARELGEYGRRIETEDEESRDPNVRLKRVRSAFYAMTGRGGHMTRRGGGSVRS